MNNNKIIKNISLDEKRKIYVNKKLDVTIIEIKKEDGIKCFSELDVNFFLRTKKKYFAYQIHIIMKIYIL